MQKGDERPRRAVALGRLCGMKLCVLLALLQSCDKSQHSKEGRGSVYVECDDLSSLCAAVRCA